MSASQQTSGGGSASRSLPDRPSIDNLRKRAKCLHKLLKSGDADSIARVRQGLPRLSGMPDADVPQADVKLQEVQHVIAVEYGYSRWNDLIEAVSTDNELPDDSLVLLWRRGLDSYEGEAAGIYYSLSHRHTRPDEWIRRMVPRFADMDDEAIAASITLEDARQALATQLGHDSFEELAADARKLRPVGTFEDLADLDDREIRELIWRVGRDDLAVAMKAASEHFKERFLANMPEAEREALTEHMEWLGPMPLHDVEMVQMQITKKFRTEYQWV